MEERNYKNGIFQGKSIYYFSNGDIEERYYENGLVQGLAIYKFTNGEVSLRLYNYGSLILESFPENI